MKQCLLQKKKKKKDDLLRADKDVGQTELSFTKNSKTIDEVS